MVWGGQYQPSVVLGVPGQKIPDAATTEGESARETADPAVRRGKWTTEEEDYANRLIQEFHLGWLRLAEGSTLRTFLAKVLKCDPMRISKKYVGANSIGKQVFKKCSTTDMTESEIKERTTAIHEDLRNLERRFAEKVLVPRKRSNASSLKQNSHSSAGGSGNYTSDRDAAAHSSIREAMGARRSSRIPKETSWKRVLEQPEEEKPQKRRNRTNGRPGDALVRDPHQAGAFADTAIPNTLSSVGRVGSLDMLCAYTTGEMPLPGGSLSRSSLTSDGGDEGLRQSVVDLMSLGLSSGVGTGAAGLREEKKSSSSASYGPGGSGGQNNSLRDDSHGRWSVGSPPPLKRVSSYGSVSAEDVGMEYDAPTPRSASGSPRNNPRLVASQTSPRSPTVGIAQYDPTNDSNVSCKVKNSINKFQEIHAARSISRPMKVQTSSVEDFLSLVNQGVIPSPDEKLLSRPLNGAA